MFEIISSIIVDDEATWKDKLFLTFDVDWAHDEVLRDSIDLVVQSGVRATWFVTHDTYLLQRLRTTENCELGIHPNFNFLLNGDGRNGRTAQEVMDRLTTIVPEAKAVRSHSMTQSSQLIDIFKMEGLTHDCNHFIPESAGIEIKPWILWNEMVRVPYFWEDDVALIYEQHSQCRRVNALAQGSGLKVFDFHPIHVFLNTEVMDRYERTRHLHYRPDELIKHRHEGEGTRTRLLDLLELAKTSKARRA